MKVCLVLSMVSVSSLYRLSYSILAFKSSYAGNNNAESYWLVGKGMGEAIVELVLRREMKELLKERADKDVTSSILR